MQYEIPENPVALNEFLERNAEVDGVCMILLPDELRRLIECLKKFCFK